MILDTNAVSDLFGGDPSLKRILSAGHQHQLPVIVIAEYKFGMLRSKRQPRLGALLERLIAESDVLEIDLETTGVYAELRNQLHRRSRPLPQNDLWIAALAIQHRQPLVSRDLHFDAIAGLRRLSW